MIPATEYRQTAIDRLHAAPCSCVIVRGDSVTVCHGRGVSDLYRIYTTQPESLSGAFVADKVIGKGAAALMIAGGVAGVYTDLISVPALELFRSVGIEPEFARCVPNIINRNGDGICPVETLCRDCVSASACIPLIADFIEKINQKH
ncbi:DUF1893 domain-containing protein [uncultured Duncaniella sp.]|uniref:DUF1893 domain-containing protein n=1 Tax=uncultured Duncaniella sp. TaxID=2768039 RepID=UPI0025AF50F0|nr:DUF1893 domain-containing protein [uncultured Duncaniella sp.]